MKKESPWAGGFTPHKATKKFTCVEAEKIADEIHRAAVAMFIERVEEMPVEWQCATAMSLSDRMTALFVSGICRNDTEHAATLMAQHTVNVMRRIRKEIEDE